MYKYIMTPMLNDESGRKAGRKQANMILMQALAGMTSTPSHREDGVEAEQCFEGMREELGPERRVADGFVASHNEGHRVGMYRRPNYVWVDMRCVGAGRHRHMEHIDDHKIAHRADDLSHCARSCMCRLERLETQAPGCHQHIGAHLQKLG